jgi:redox-sensitive bicupin YhaK (pirin superfamily)
MNAFVYVYRGKVSIADAEVSERQMAILEQDAHPVVRFDASGACKLLLIAGRPLKEPIVQYGPFVMNSQQQITQAIADYRGGLFQNVKVRQD